MTVTTLAYTGAVQSFTVQPGTTFVTVECWGAASPSASASGGQGGYAKGALIVAPGTVLNAYVGGSTGWNGGAVGGASDVRVGGTALSNRVIVAGGGGSSYINAFGGHGGGGVGDTGVNAYGAAGGVGGTQTSGYALGQGEVGGAPGGGGGGGYWGGYAGGSNAGAYGGGGGGSGYTGTLVNPVMSNGVRAGNGQIVITAVNTAPLAPTLNTPANNAYVYASTTTPFGWTVNDPDPGDSQSRADFQWRVGAGAWTVVNNAATTVAQYVAAGATFTAGTQVEWQVRTYDVAGLVSPWSASSFVNVIAALTAPTITAPAAGSSQFSTPVSMSWTLPAGPPSSDAYQVVRSSATGATGTIYYDSAVVLSSALSASVPLDATAGRTDYLNVRFRYGGQWSPYVSSTISNQFGPPQVPLLVLTLDSNLARVMVVITNPAAGGGFASTVSNDLIRTSPDGTVARIGKALAANATVVDGLPGAGLNDYKVTAYAASGSTNVSA